MQRFWLAGRRLVRCSICVSPSPRCWLISRASPSWRPCTRTADSITIGATVTHAAIEDGRIADPTGGFLARVARGIAYRAVRSRGTIGGSLAHADPAADWLSCLTALGAEVLVRGAQGARSVALAGFMRGAMETELAHDELVVGIRVPKFSSRARFGYHKICRKTGEFAEAIGVVVDDPDRDVVRLVASTATGAPIVLRGQGSQRRYGRLAASPDGSRPRYGIPMR